MRIQKIILGSVVLLKSKPKPKPKQKAANKMASKNQQSKKFSVYADGKLAFADNDYNTANSAAQSLMKLGRSVWLAKTGSFVPLNVASK